MAMIAKCLFYGLSAIASVYTMYQGATQQVEPEKEYGRSHIVTAGFLLVLMILSW